MKCHQSFKTLATAGDKLSVQLVAVENTVTFVLPCRLYGGVEERERRRERDLQI